MHINDLYNDPYYNAHVDLETTFPVAIIPVVSPVTGEVVGAYEYSNIKAIKTRTSHKRSDLDILDQKMIESFSKIIAIAYSNIV